jgi:hypothetical protein
VRPDLPDEQKAFIARHIETLAHLDVLLFLCSQSEKAWSAGDVTRELRGTQESVVRWLNHLETTGLVARDGELFRFHPASPEHANQVKALQQVYMDRPVLVIEHIYSRPNPQLLDFVRAFERRKKT